MAGFVKDVEKLESQYFAYSNVEWYSHCEELCDVPKISKHKLSYDLAIPFLFIYFKTIGSKDLTSICTSMLIPVLFSQNGKMMHMSTDR